MFKLGASKIPTDSGSLEIVRSTFIKNLPILKAANVGAVNWGFVIGKTNTIYVWDDKSHTYGSEPPLWFHDIFRKDGAAFSKEEVESAFKVNGLRTFTYKSIPRNKTVII